MGTKIKIYETEIKRAVRRKLMERFVDESEEMTVYDQDEFNSSFDKLEKGSYGVKDTQGKIRSVTVNEDDEELDDPQMVGRNRKGVKPIKVRRK